MATYQFKLPDIGEGIAEAEVVAWHVKVGDRVEEDQQLADMMTDKATVEMESPVAGTVTKLAGEVGDMLAIGSVLVEIETEGEVAAPESRDEQPLGDGAVVATPAMKEEIPTSATANAPLPPAGGAGGGPVSKAAAEVEIAPPPGGRGALSVALVGSACFIAGVAATAPNPPRCSSPPSRAALPGVAASARRAISRARGHTDLF